METVTSPAACSDGLNVTKLHETLQPSGVHINTTTILLLTVLGVVVLLLLMCGMACMMCFVKNRRNAKRGKGDICISTGSLDMYSPGVSHKILQEQLVNETIVMLWMRQT